MLEMQYEERVAPTQLDDDVLSYDRWEYNECCLICGDPIDYCLGHGAEGEMLYEAHDSDDHSHCHPNGCEEAYGAIVDGVQ